MFILVNLCGGKYFVLRVKLCPSPSPSPQKYNWQMKNCSMLKWKQVNFLPLSSTVCENMFYTCMHLKHFMCAKSNVRPLSVFFVLICIHVLFPPPEIRLKNCTEKNIIIELHNHKLFSPLHLSSCNMSWIYWICHGFIGTVGTCHKYNVLCCYYKVHVTPNAPVVNFIAVCITCSSLIDKNLIYSMDSTWKYKSTIHTYFVFILISGRICIQIICLCIRCFWSFAKLLFP